MTNADYLRMLDDESLARFCVDLLMAKPITNEECKALLYRRWLRVLQDEYELC